MTYALHALLQIFVYLQNNLLIFVYPQDTCESLRTCRATCVSLYTCRTTCESLSTAGWSLVADLRRAGRARATVRGQGVYADGGRGGGCR